MTNLERAQEFERMLRMGQMNFQRDSIEDLELDEDDFSVHAKPEAPPIPDMRFEKQVEATIQNLRNKGSSQFGIFWSIVIKDQVIMPFINGFIWCIGTHAWSWYRTKSVVKSPKRTFGFFRGIHYGFTEWTKSVYEVMRGSKNTL